MWIAVLTYEISLKEEVVMMNFSKKVITVFALIAVVSLSSVAHAGRYNAQKITQYFAVNNGAVHITWAGAPRPSTCGGENWGMYYIPATSHEQLKDLALSLYLSGKRARIDTKGCQGASEIVTSILGL